MGNPFNYSLDLPQRCLRLIDQTWNHVSDIFPQENNQLGPMTSTFLLSMSMPIINIPIERIEQAREKYDQIYLSDRLLDKEMSLAIDKTISKGKLNDAPFYIRYHWRFHRINVPPMVNIADGLPECVANALIDDASAEAAAAMPTSQWRGILRNALAHGGIAYLDENGHSSWGTPVKMYAFASGKYDEESPDRPKPLIAVNFLRISETDYREFLRLWVQWLEQSGITRALEAA